jgi:hypothetical protein
MSPSGQLHQLTLDGLMNVQGWRLPFTGIPTMENDLVYMIVVVLLGTIPAVLAIFLLL